MEGKRGLSIGSGGGQELYSTEMWPKEEQALYSTAQRAGVEQALYSIKERQGAELSSTIPPAGKQNITLKGLFGFLDK